MSITRGLMGFLSYISNASLYVSVCALGNKRTVQNQTARIAARYFECWKTYTESSALLPC
jgi:hypothetical protein